MVQVNYNERSWAIDLISTINKWATKQNTRIKRAGGEKTIKSDTGSLFPDVLLYGTGESGCILQGWELKMPDTPITDSEFINNAKNKAKTLKLDSFLLWNVTSAVLYRIIENDKLVIIKTWNELNYIHKREDVEPNLEAIYELLHEILSDLGYFFEEGTIHSAPIIEVINGEGIANIILQNISVCAANIKENAKKNPILLDEITIWWRYEKKSYPDESEPWSILAKHNLLTLVNKLIFAHVLKIFTKEAFIVDNISEKNSVSEILKIFHNLSKKCDFWNIFKKHLGEEYIPQKNWENIAQLNYLLSDFKIQELSVELLHEFLNNLVKKEKRKIAGQFTTPIELARILSYLTIRDKSKNILDPCCGTGTIPKAAYELKKQFYLDSKKAISEIWASDKFSFPLQIATLALSTPENIGSILQIFTEDASNLAINMPIKLQDPYNGKELIKPLPAMGYILSNLPYVQQEDIDLLNPGIRLINDKIKELTGQSTILDGRSDLFAYLPFYLWHILEDDGKLGIIIGNSWLSTKWGNVFRKLLNKFYDIECAITSGKGRWFKNAKVVTNIVILKKRHRSEVKNTSDKSTKFIILNKEIEKIDQEDLHQEITSLIQTNNELMDNDIRITSYEPEEIEVLENLGVGWSSLFGDIKWMKDIKDKLIQANELFEINRGERRGWDSMFYPEEKNNIEKEYLQKVLKSPRDISDLTVEGDGVAFCCNLSKEQLKEKKHFGALEWIEKFENGVNTAGRPLPEVLRRSGLYWYTMLPNALADIVTSMNPGDRLFFAKLKERAFVNQRLIRLTARNIININLCHALLNSTLGIFYLEALGFGRGEGALDLSSDKLKSSLYILNPTLLSKKQVKIILEKFTPILKRPIMTIEEVLSDADQMEFDKAILDSFGIGEYQVKIKDSLLALYKIRMSVDC